MIFNLKRSKKKLYVHDLLTFWDSDTLHTSLNLQYFTLCPSTEPATHLDIYHPIHHFIMSFYYHEVMTLDIIYLIFIVNKSAMVAHKVRFYLIWDYSPSLKHFLLPYMVQKWRTGYPLLATIPANHCRSQRNPRMLTRTMTIVDNQLELFFALE